MEEIEKQEEWSLKITLARNGYILEGTHDGSGLPFTEVIEDDDKDDLKSHEELLWLVMEYFNFQGSKHDRERLQVVREKRND